MNQKYLSLLRHNLALNEELLETLEALLNNPFAYSEYRCSVVVPKDYDLDLIKDYIYVVREIDSNHLIVTLLGGVYTEHDYKSFKELTKNN
ncbi:TPA: hypothetical protein MNE64_001505 [Escherichia coli]|nr:hypothetical protein [Escherichia coli]